MTPVRTIPPEGPPLAHARRALLRMLPLSLCVALLALALSDSIARALPDNRAYELVTRYEEGGHEVGINGLEALLGTPSVNGDAFDWEAFGGCCGSTSAGFSVFQSERRPTGWQTRSLNPTPKEPIVGFTDWEGMEFSTPDLQKNIWTTPGGIDPSDKLPPGATIHDLYLQGPSGEMTWLTQGPLAVGEDSRAETLFDGATPDAGVVLFGTTEQLTANASGLAATEMPDYYLYAREVAKDATSLVDVNNSGTLLNPYGASIGASGNIVPGSLFSTTPEGTTTNAISENGEKIFFETPPPGVTDLPPGEMPHLYMRDLADGTTTPLDDPTSSGSAQYEGASKDGSLVFFTSNEHLDGASAENELYIFNTTANQIGSIAPMSSIPVTESGSGIVGESAISNDGSRVFFVAESVLSYDSNPVGRVAKANQPNLYVYDTLTGQTTFIASLSLPDVDACKSGCWNDTLGGLVREPDVERPIVPTPDGSTLVFDSGAQLTGSDGGTATQLTAEAPAKERTLTVASTSGFAPKEMIAIGTGSEEEVDQIESIESSTQLRVSEYTEKYAFGAAGAHPAGAPVVEFNVNAYRYSLDEGTLTCVSCAPAGVTPTGSAAIGEGIGGSYAPSQDGVPMSEDGSRIFFTSPDPLVPEATPAVTSGLGKEPTSLYEWESGKISLITPESSIGLRLDGTTPSGNDVFFTSRLHLIPGAVTDDEMIYDARVDGGFPLPATSTPCTSQSCRPQSVSTTFFPVPPSEAAGASPTSPPVASLPSFIVGRITPAQRVALARTGRLGLDVTTTGPGQIDGVALARIHGAMGRVAHASATLSAAGKVELRLSLGAAAMKTLRAGKSLKLQIEVSYSGGGATSVAEMTVKRAGAGGHTNHA